MVQKTVTRLVANSRWTGIRLWVYRSSQDFAPAAVLIRTAEGRSQQDRIISSGQAYIPPGSMASKSAIHALVAALVACYGGGLVEAALDDILAAEPLRGPRRGATGGSPDQA